MKIMMCTDKLYIINTAALCKRFWMIISNFIVTLNVQQDEMTFHARIPGSVSAQQIFILLSLFTLFWRQRVYKDILLLCACLSWLMENQKVTVQLQLLYECGLTGLSSCHATFQIKNMHNYYTFIILSFKKIIYLNLRVVNNQMQLFIWCIRANTKNCT